MVKHLFLACAAASLILAAGHADQSKDKVVIGVTNINPTDAKQMYTGYCAPCHGNDGRGSGPMARTLKNKPTDLTTLAHANHGKFPETHVVSILQFGKETPVHGDTAMPAWGHLFNDMSYTNPQLTNLRIGNLTHYLESMQTK